MTILIPTRRGFIGGLIASLAAPAIVHAANLMPISVFKELHWASVDGMPPGWFHCDGGLLRCADHPELFRILDRWHGGDGVTTFAVPDLRHHEIPGRLRQSKYLVSAINGHSENGISAGTIRALNKPRIPLPADTSVYYSPFSGYTEFPPREWKDIARSLPSLPRPSVRESLKRQFMHLIK